MSRIEPTLGNRKLLEVDVPAVPVELARLTSPVHVGERSVVLRCAIHEHDYW